MKPDIIAENEWLVAIDKPAGLIVHGDGRTEEPSLSEWIAEAYPKLRGVGGAWISPQGVSIPLNGLVHRLDRSTSGVVLAAKDNDVFEYLKAEFKMRRIGKKYLAWVYGVTSATDGTIIAEIARSSFSAGGPRRWYAHACPQDDPRAAITVWRVVARGENATLLEVFPKTGRTHQIRVHLASIGHPVVADHLYARETEPILGFKRPALHALAITTTLPDGERKEFVAPEPEDFLNAR